MRESRDAQSVFCVDRVEATSISSAIYRKVTLAPLRGRILQTRPAVTFPKSVLSPTSNKGIRYFSAMREKTIFDRPARTTIDFRLA
jgi:hypothetical protein